MACDQAKEFLSHAGVEFTVRNVAEDPAARQELLDLGFRATPVFRVGNEMVVGFDRGKLERLLGLKR